MLKITAIGNLTNDVTLKTSVVRSLPGRAASWQLPVILRPSPLRMSRSVSPVSSSKPARWSSSRPAR